MRVCDYFYVIARAGPLSCGPLILHTILGGVGVDLLLFLLQSDAWVICGDLLLPVVYVPFFFFRRLRSCFVCRLICWILHGYDSRRDCRRCCCRRCQICFCLGADRYECCFPLLSYEILHHCMMLRMRPRVPPRVRLLACCFSIGTFFCFYLAYLDYYLSYFLHLYLQFFLCRGEFSLTCDVLCKKHGMFSLILKPYFSMVCGGGGYLWGKRDKFPAFAARGARCCWSCALS